MNEDLIEFRENEGFTPERMSIEIGVSPSYYYKIEQGTRNPSYNFLTKIKNRFPEIDLNMFITIDESEDM